MSTPDGGAWAPLRLPLFRALWLAVLVSNIGTWMQTVGAQWLLVEEPGASGLVPLVQTAATLPVAVLALPAGVLADSFDKRRLLLGVQAFSLSVGVLLTVLTALDQVRPTVLLLLTLALGAGMALTAPAYQSLIPELVPREQIPAASALGAVSVNLARSVGPALAGLLIAQVGPAAVFGLNALSFGVFALTLLLWRRPEEPRVARERFGPALRAGGRYVRHSPSLRRLLARVSAFTVPAMAVWGLLPLVASERLGLGPGGYGLLLGAVGVGAVGGAVALPWLRTRLGTNATVGAGSLLYAAAMALVVLGDALPVVLVALLPVGAGWIAVLSTANASVQLYLPHWVRARGLAVHQLVLFSSQAAGAALWGVVAQAAGLRAAYLAAAAVMGLATLTLLRWPLRDTSQLDRTPASYWPEPQLVVAPDDTAGPVLVTLDYAVVPALEADFLAAMQSVRRSRLRTGAVSWQLYRSGEVSQHFVEQYVVPTWAEHLRQHAGRLTGSDREAEARAVALSDPPPVSAHLFPTGALGSRRPVAAPIGPGPVGETGG